MIPRRTVSTDELILTSPGAGVAAEKAMARLRVAGDLLDVCEHLDAELRDGPGAFVVMCLLHPTTLYCHTCAQDHLDDAGAHPDICFECGTTEGDIGILTGLAPLRSGAVLYIDGLKLCAPCASQVGRLT